MIRFIRNNNNPIIKPNPNNLWEAQATFNGSVIKNNNIYYMVYRALSLSQNWNGRQMSLSTIGYAQSSDGAIFTDRKQFIKPEMDWEKFGCEDPRITKIDDDYFVFYTALSDYPFYPAAIKIGVACFTDFTKQIEKHLATPFNSKAMTLFPEKINGKYAALLTVNTDLPPSQICLALFDKKEDIWSGSYWNNWYKNLDEHILPLRRINSDQLEIGAAPIYTSQGWLLIYSHIQHYHNPENRTFGIEAVLLDHENPQKIIARTDNPIMVPETEYELNGNISNIVFPSGAILEKDVILIYYGATDTTCCLATCSLNDLFKEMNVSDPVALKVKKPLTSPLLTPLATHAWESKAVLNPGAFYDGEKIYLFYRAMSEDNTSVIGSAQSFDGMTITKRNEIPIYVPRAGFEIKKIINGNSGCEDPRITQIGDNIYMLYTAFNGIDPPRVALTSISKIDFLSNNFSWKEPILISPPGIDDKDAAIFPEKINGKYVIIHRIQNSIVFDYVDNLDFSGENWLRSISYIPPRGDSWDSEKIGLCTPPIKTEKGWVLLYHGVSKISHHYRVGAMLLDLEKPDNVLSRTPWPILEPELLFEREGIVRNVVFPCGAIVKDDTLFIYYGGADTVVGVATVKFSVLLNYLLEVKDKEYIQ
jgi:beta-1,2-mannobiose phosphorylase / 1,2-beta-oligomannan phosphorylase